MNSRLERFLSYFTSNDNDSKSFQTDVIVEDGNNELRFNKERITGKRKLIRHQLQQRNYRIDVSIKKWKAALSMAEDKLTPNRELLYLMYHIVMEDDHLLSQCRTARYSVQMAPFQVEVNKKVNEDLKELFETPWFFQYLEYCFDTELFGHSLIEVSEKDDAGKIKSIYLVPRTHVKPEYQSIVLSPSDYKGIAYNEGKLQKSVIAIGKDDDLGILKSMSKSIIRKNFNLDDWGRKNEKFGMPFVIGRTASRDDQELDAKESMLRNFGANMWALLDDEDSVELLADPSNANGKGHMTYLEYCEYIDKCIAILINGQTSTSEEKSHVGSAEVHERVMNKYTLARLKRIEYHINFELIPWLVKYYNYPLLNAKFQFLDLLEENKDAGKQTDPTKEPATKKKS